jgi:shikimate dehydrogenase
LCRIFYLKMKRYGLVGKNITYSFSRSYFAEKFAAQDVFDCAYENFDLVSIAGFPELLRNYPDLKGLNVTIPYKEAIIPYLDSLSETAAVIGAVNTIKFHANGQLEGFNTDQYGFAKSLEPLLKMHHQKALILGTGGASKAVAFALKTLGIDYRFVSRNFSETTIRYEDLETVFDNYQIVINTTPVGTFPNTGDCPNILYERLTSQHIAYDLIYNPAETLFLQKAKSHGAIVKNGLEMLELQADKAWEIWNS